MKQYIDVVNELNAGVTADTLTTVLSEAASRTLANGKMSEVTLTIKLKPVKGSGDQAEVESIIKYKVPTLKGDKSETAADTMVMYVSTKGALSTTPEKQLSIPQVAE